MTVENGDAVFFIDGEVFGVIDKYGLDGLDLGCGDGEFALALAERHPDVYVIAADMLLGRVRKVQKRVLR
ncbi:MAG: hypothetical protein IK143_02325, partial [Bacteroidales bacterium]|nr:hypothetical protein [Bacteroidales bacterium]